MYIHAVHKQKYLFQVDAYLITLTIILYYRKRNYERFVHIQALNSIVLNMMFYDLHRIQ